MCRAIDLAAFIAVEINRADDYSLREMSDGVSILAYVFTAVLMVIVR